MGSKWAESGLEEDWKRAGSGLKLGYQWIENRLQGCKWAENPKLTFEVRVPIGGRVRMVELLEALDAHPKVLNLRLGVLQHLLSFADEFLIPARQTLNHVFGSLLHLKQQNCTPN